MSRALRCLQVLTEHNTYSPHKVHDFWFHFQAVLVWKTYVHVPLCVFIQILKHTWVCFCFQKLILEVEPSRKHLSGSFIYSPPPPIVQPALERPGGPLDRLQLPWHKWLFPFSHYIIITKKKKPALQNCVLTRCSLKVPEGVGRGTEAQAVSKEV
ncbi:UNVERIFIED_CONTAM: hypothetical protein K2H54_058278 [Gekko kuhli]